MGMPDGGGGAGGGGGAVVVGGTVVGGAVVGATVTGGVVGVAVVVGIVEAAAGRDVAGVADDRPQAAAISATAAARTAVPADRAARRRAVRSGIGVADVGS